MLSGVVRQTLLKTNNKRVVYVLKRMKQDTVEVWKSERLTGTCKFFHESKGYGFIDQDGVDPQRRNADIFVHGKYLHSKDTTNPTLAVGERVEYTATVDVDKGMLMAIDVTGPNGAYVNGVDPKKKEQLPKVKIPREMLVPPDDPFLVYHDDTYWGMVSDDDDDDDELWR